MSILCTISFVSCNKEEKSGRNHEFNYGLSGNPENLDPQLAVDNASITIIENTFEGLTDIDEKGVLTYGVAEKCEISEDCLKYTFKLKEDCYWYNGISKYIVKAEDFVFAFRRIFNPVTCSPYKDTFSFIKNGSKIIDGKMSYEKIGVTATDDFTVVFELDQPEPRFMEMLSTSPAMPCHKDFFDSTKARYGLDDESVISNGSFYIQQWFYDPYGKDNFLYLRRNPANNADNEVIPYSVNFVIEKSEEDVQENFKNGDYDALVTDSSSEFKGIVSKSFEINEYQDKTIGFIINHEKITDENIKNALVLSLDRQKYKDKLMSNYSCAYGIIPPSLKIGSRNYRDISDEKMLNYYDLESAKKYAENSSVRTLKILTCKKYGETVYINDIVSQWEEKLGIEIIVEEKEYDEYLNSVSAGEYDLAVYQLTADYDNPYDILYDFISTDNVFKFSHSQTNQLLKDAGKINGSEKRTQLYMSAEKNIIDNCGFIPLYYKKTYFIYGNKSEDIIFNPFTNEINFRNAKNYS